MLSAKSSALGGAGRAAVESVDSLYLNPAGIGLLNSYYFGSGYAYGSLSPGVARETFAFTLTDGTPGVMVPGSLGYRYHRVHMDQQDFKEHEFRAGFGRKLGNRFSVGAAYTNIRSEGDQGLVYRQNNADVGVLFMATEAVSFSLTGEGLIKQDAEIPVGLQRTSRWGLGTLFKLEQLLQLRYDVLSPLYAKVREDRFIHQVGLGLTMRGYFTVNLGFINDDVLENNWYTAGLVWEGPRLKLGYSLQNETRAGLGTRHLVDLWLDI